jgi:hypothetical protein
MLTIVGGNNNARCNERILDLLCEEILKDKPNDKISESDKHKNNDRYQCGRAYSGRNTYTSSISSLPDNQRLLSELHTQRKELLSCYTYEAIKELSPAETSKYTFVRFIDELFTQLIHLMNCMN